MAPRIWLDLTSFLSSGALTGIQRVALELVTHWPRHVPVGIVRLAPGRVDTFHCLPASAPRLLRRMSAARSRWAREALADDLRQLSHQASERWRPGPPGTDVLFVPELFFEDHRCAAYEALGGRAGVRVAFLVNDILPLTHPDLFPFTTTQLMAWAKTLRQADALAFISEATRVAFHRFDAHRPEGPFAPPRRDELVAVLGADGLRPARRVPTRARALRGPPTFVAMGTMEPRKKVALILDVFERLWRTGSPARLTWAGSAGWVDNTTYKRVVRLQEEEPRFHWLHGATDAELARQVRGAAAVLYPSEQEGFGLPPLEALWLGTPVVVSTTIPAVEALPPGGQLRLRRVDAASMEEALARLMDPAFRGAKELEIAALPLPTWDGFAATIAEWLQALPASLPARRPPAATGAAKSSG